MAISEEDKREIKDLFFEALREHYEAYGMDASTHSKDHNFLCEWRKSTDAVKVTTLRVAVGTVVAGVLALIWMAFNR